MEERIENGWAARVVRVVIACAMVSAIGCGDDDAVVPDGGGPSDGGGRDGGGRDGGTRDAGPGTDAGVTDGGMVACALGHLIVTTTAVDFTTAGLGALTLADGTADVATDPLPDTDPVAVRAGCRGYVLERGNGVVRVQSATDPLETAASFDVDPAGTTTPYASNPVAVVEIDDTEAWVVNLARNELTVVDPTVDGDAAIQGTIDLTPYLKKADMDGHVDATDAIRVGDRVYVALGHYWFDSGFAIHFEGSQLAVIDATTRELVDVQPGTTETDGIDLEVENPWRGLAYSEAANELWVGATGDSFAIDGGIYRIDLATNTRTGLVTDEMMLSGEINGFARYSDARVFVLLSDRVVAIDPTTPAAPDEIATGIDGILLHGDTLYAWARDGETAGLRAFDAETGDETTPSAGPWAFGAHPIFTVAPAP